MKTRLILLITVFMLVCSSSLQAKEKNSGRKLLNKTVAEKILGEASNMKEDSIYHDKDAESYKRAFIALEKEATKERPCSLYFLYEKYKRLADAEKKYSFIKQAKEKNGIKTLNDLGDEAYFHTDGSHFYFIMVRKGNRVFNMKVNMITSKA